MTFKEQKQSWLFVRKSHSLSSLTFKLLFQFCIYPAILVHALSTVTDRSVDKIKDMIDKWNGAHCCSLLIEEITGQLNGRQPKTLQMNTFLQQIATSCGSISLVGFDSSPSLRRLSIRLEMKVAFECSEFFDGTNYP